MKTIAEWEERSTDQPYTHAVIRLIHCRLRYWDAQAAQWVERISLATAYGDREEAYQTARQVGGLLFIYDR